MAAQRRVNLETLLEITMGVMTHESASARLNLPETGAGIDVADSF